MLRALYFPQDCSEIERMTYTFIMQKTWTKVVQVGNQNYPNNLKDGDISEDPFKILEKVTNKNDPQIAQFLTTFNPIKIK